MNIDNIVWARVFGLVWEFVYNPVYKLFPLYNYNNNSIFNILNGDILREGLKDYEY